MLTPGTPFPDFAVPNQEGETTKLADFAGHWLVVYFYPKDDTPGCTIQGQSFTRSKDEFDAADIRIVGVSADDVTSHKRFWTKFAFRVDLLADSDSGLMKTLGLPQKEWKGMKLWERTTFVVDPRGIVRKVYERVDPNGHERVLLNDIKLLQAEQAAA
jgi:peroxiredoxin Q/BCP